MTKQQANLLDTHSALPKPKGRFKRPLCFPNLGCEVTEIQRYFASGKNRTGNTIFAFGKNRSVFCLTAKTG